MFSIYFRQKMNNLDNQLTHDKKFRNNFCFSGESELKVV